MRFVSQRTMSASGGYISGSGISAGDIDMNGGRLLDSAGPLNLGADATTSRSLTSDDVLFGGAVEVDGKLYVDDAFYVASTSYVKTLSVADNESMIFRRSLYY